MIYESKYWKDDLLRKAASLEKKKRQKRWLESSYAMFEKDIMIGFYTIRKLMESYKVDTAYSSKQVHLHSHELKDGPSTLWKRWEFFEVYDMEVSKKETMKLIDVCNQIIHSFHFFVAWSEDSDLEGIYFNSDRLRQQRLLFLEVDKIIDLFNEIGNNYPNSARSTGPLGCPDTIWIQETRPLEKEEENE